ncbi:MAG TPA: hypothetical protein VHJ78_12415 [Actinomycetota bacterium]|nr:hypothetical protein [Actinomycetota bacterium]
MAKKRLLSLIAMLLTVALLGAACGNSGAEQQAAAQEAADTPTAVSAAADLRSGMTALLGEHVYLAALATGSALRGDTAGFNAWAAALNGETDSNSADVVAAVRSAYGDDVGSAFDGLWRSENHIPAFVRYTESIAKNDRAGADRAVADLTAYAKSFGETMNQVNDNLPAAAVEEGITMHAETLIAVIDAQKAGDQTAVYSGLREAYHHMDELAATLAGATVQKFPKKFEGDPSSKASELRAGMTSLLQEHVFLAASATGAALGGRTAQFQAAAAALNGETGSNSADVIGAIRSVYGDEVGNAFNGLWRSEGHIPAFVAYTQAVAKNDTAGAAKAVNDLMGYAATFGQTMNQVNDKLAAADVEEAIKMHATTLKAVVDAQKARDAGTTATTLREAAHHMGDTAKVLAQATVEELPEKF